MVPVYAATLPPASVLPLGGSLLLTIDAFGVCVLLAAVLVIGAGILVARERANRVEGVGITGITFLLDSPPGLR